MRASLDRPCAARRLLVLLIAAAAVGTASAQDAAITAKAAAQLGLAPDATAASVSSAFVPLTAAGKAQLMASIMAGNAVAKAQVKEALANPAAAFEAYAADMAAAQARAAPGDFGAAAAVPGGAGDRLSRSARLRIFTANLKKIDALNAVSDTVAYGITRFTHMTNAEFARIMLPHNFAVDATAATVTEAGPAAADAADAAGSLGRKLKAAATYSTINWRTAGFVTDVRDQGQCGSCAAFASTVLAEYCYIKRYNTTAAATNLSEQDLLDCMSGNQCNGATLTTYPAVMKKAVSSGGGSAQETADPYRANDATNTACVSGIARKATLSNYNMVSPTIAAYEAALKTAPLEIAIEAGGATFQHYQYGTYKADFKAYGSGVFDCVPGAAGTINHAVSIVGFVNQAAVTNSTGGTVTWDVWIVKNSWGTYWGGQNLAPYTGFFFARKDCGGVGAFNMYTTNAVQPAC